MRTIITIALLTTSLTKGELSKTERTILNHYTSTIERSSLPPHMAHDYIQRYESLVRTTKDVKLQKAFILMKVPSYIEMNIARLESGKVFLKGAKPRKMTKEEKEELLKNCNDAMNLLKKLDPRHVKDTFHINEWVKTLGKFDLKKGG